MENTDSPSGGGYDCGYASCPCFWGKLPGTLIREYLTANSSLNGCHVLDLGCGEGKNAFAFAEAGALVDAVDCSVQAIANGQKAFANPNIRWIHSDAASHLSECGNYDLIVMYGLLHCFPTMNEISRVVNLAIGRTDRRGTHFVVSFNDGPHDLSAHPNFRPTLISHENYLSLYRNHHIISAHTAVIHESHPNNNIPHFHSITRLTARIIHDLS
jgi:tellurite methyltransferase